MKLGHLHRTKELDIRAATRATMLVLYHTRWCMVLWPHWSTAIIIRPGRTQTIAKTHLVYSLCCLSQRHSKHQVYIQGLRRDCRHWYCLSRRSYCSYIHEYYRPAFPWLWPSISISYQSPRMRFFQIYVNSCHNVVMRCLYQGLLCGLLRAQKYPWHRQPLHQAQTYPILPRQASLYIT